MTEREEFDAWVRESLVIPMNFDKLDCMWATWQGARASRWRAPSSAVLDERVLVCWGDDSCLVGYRCGPGQFWMSNEDLSIETPASYHPLPDPPTKEELERLK